MDGGFIEMVVLKQPQQTLNDLPNYCQYSLLSRQLMNAQLRVCGEEWAAKVVDEKVVEIWIKN